MDGTAAMASASWRVARIQQTWSAGSMVATATLSVQASGSRDLEISCAVIAASFFLLSGFCFATVATHVESYFDDGLIPAPTTGAINAAEEMKEDAA